MGNMITQSGFIDYLLELLEPLGDMRARRMFGGHGLYRDGLMFGLVADDILYLKTDAQNRPSFEARGLPPFTYERSGKSAVVMSYHRAPEEVLEESEALCGWARDALAAAQRGAAVKRRPSKRKKIVAHRR